MGLQLLMSLLSFTSSYLASWVNSGDLSTFEGTSHLVSILQTIAYSDQLCNKSITFNDYRLQLYNFISMQFPPSHTLSLTSTPMSTDYHNNHQAEKAPAVSSPSPQNTSGLSGSVPPIPLSPPDLSQETDSQLTQDIAQAIILSCLSLTDSNKLGESSNFNADTEMLLLSSTILKAETSSPSQGVTLSPSNIPPKTSSPGKDNLSSWSTITCRYAPHKLIAAPTQYKPIATCYKVSSLAK